MPLSTKELIQNIPNEPDARNSRYVRIIKAMKQGKGDEYHYNTITRIPGESPRKHKQWIKDLSGKGLYNSTEIFVSCDCERFKFKWEYALWKRGASMIKFSNGEPPVTTNPNLHPAACKHCYVVLSDILKKKSKYK